MLHAARDVSVRCQGIEHAQFAHDETLQYALYYLFTVIGEAARRLSPDTRDWYSDVPWLRMIGMRNRLVHEYDEIDVDLVWDAATRDVPRLIARLEAILASDQFGEDAQATPDSALVLVPG